MFVDPATKLITVPLTEDHTRESFSSGVQSLDVYFSRQAGQDQRRNVSQCFVGLEDDQRTPLGYYTLSNTGIFVMDLGEEHRKKLPRYPLVGGVLIGRLAVDRKYQGKGFGKLFLFDALRRCANLSEEIGIYTVVVDAKDQKTANFYSQYGFIPLTNDSLKLHLPLKTIKKALE